MTKAQKLILIVLAVIAVSLGIGLFVLHRTALKTTPQQQGEIPIVDVELTPSPTDLPTASPTMRPAIEIKIPAPDEVPTATAYPITDEPYPSASPTPEPAYVHMPTAAPVNTPVPSVPKGMAFTISLLGKTINIAKDVDEETLEKHYPCKLYRKNNVYALCRIHNKRNDLRSKYYTYKRHDTCHDSHYIKYSAGHSVSVLIFLLSQITTEYRDKCGGYSATYENGIYKIGNSKRSIISIRSRAHVEYG